MMLPDRDRARVDRTKITDYLLSLSHPGGRGNAAFFLGFGFRVEAWDWRAKPTSRKSVPQIFVLRTGPPALHRKEPRRA